MKSFTFELFFSNITDNTTWNDDINGNVKTQVKNVTINDCKTIEEAEKKVRAKYPTVQVIIF